jgi:hypothetical protein
MCLEMQKRVTAMGNSLEVFNTVKHKANLRPTSSTPE